MDRSKGLVLPRLSERWRAPPSTWTNENRPRPRKAEISRLVRLVDCPRVGASLDRPFTCRGGRAVRTRRVVPGARLTERGCILPSGDERGRGDAVPGLETLLSAWPGKGTTRDVGSLRTWGTSRAQWGYQHHSVSVLIVCMQSLILHHAKRSRLYLSISQSFMASSSGVAPGVVLLPSGPAERRRLTQGCPAGFDPRPLHAPPPR